MTDGIVLINKPEGITSFTAVAKVKRILGVKCGHSGTLDPLATGLLPIMCGKATKLCQYLTDGDKLYRAELTFGIETDTHDITGTVTKTDTRSISIAEVEAILPRFIGKIKQTPPVYSAIKVNGTALYKLARSGKQDIDVPEREITINSITVLSFSENKMIFDVACSKGTYIRSLCRDIAKSLDTVGTMSALTRIETGGWNLKDAVSLEDDIEKHLIPIEKALSYMPHYTPNMFFARLLENGCEIDPVKLKGLPLENCLVYGENLIGIGGIIEKGDKKLFKIITHL